jgi:DNA-binding transcriptional LysR family regulator
MPCVLDTNMPSHSSWRFIENGEPISVHVSGPSRVNSPVAAMQAALAGLGFAVLPTYLADPQIAEGRLVRVLADRMPEGPSLTAVYPHRRHLAGKVRALIDHLVGWFETNPVR